MLEEAFAAKRAAEKKDSWDESTLSELGESN
jgi:hypothetical protein